MQFMDHLKFYINPQIYHAEQNAKNGIKDEYEKKNVEFDYQSHMGTETGRIRSRKYVRDAIAQFYEDQKASKEQIVIMGEDGLRQAVDQIREQENDGRTE